MKICIAKGRKIRIFCLFMMNENFLIYHWIFIFGIYECFFLLKKKTFREEAIISGISLEMNRLWAKSCRFKDLFCFYIIWSLCLDRMNEKKASWSYSIAIWLDTFAVIEIAGREKYWKRARNSRQQKKAWEYFFWGIWLKKFFLERIKNITLEVVDTYMDLKFLKTRKLNEHFAFWGENLYRT